MWNLVKIECHHLFLFDGDTPMRIDLRTDTGYIVCGINGDDEGVDSNGAGKSALFEVVNWVLFGRISRHADFTKAISRNDAGIGWGRITLSDGAGNYVKVYRRRAIDRKVDASVKKFTFKKKEASKYVDLTQRTFKHTQQSVNRFFGFSDDATYWSDYLSTVYFSATATRGFMATDISPIERQAIIERYLDLNTLDYMRQLAVDDARFLDNRQKVLAFDVQEKRTKLASIEKGCAEKLREAKALLSDTEKEIQECIDKRTKVENSLAEANSVITMHRNWQQLLSGLVEGKSALLRRRNEMRNSRKRYDEVESMWRKARTNYRKAKALEEETSKSGKGVQEIYTAVKVSSSSLCSNIVRIDKMMHEVEHQLSGHTVKCPRCDAELIVIGKDVKKFSSRVARRELDRLTTLRQKYASQLDRQNSKLQVIEAELQIALDATSTKNLLFDKMEAFSRAMRMVNYSVQAYVAVRKDIVAVRKKISDARKQGVDIEAKYAKIKKTVNTSDVRLRAIENRLLRLRVDKKRLEEEIAAYKVCIGMRKEWKEDIRENTKQLMQAIHELEAATFWKDRFPALKISVLQSFIPLFEAYVNEVLATFAVKERVEFRLHVTSKDTQSVRPGFNISVYDGISWDDFATYSGGEKSRILLACAYALRKLSATIKNTSLGFVMVDEVLDSMDATGIENFLAMSNASSGQRFIITHSRPEDLLATGSKIIVHRENNLSQVSVS